MTKRIRQYIGLFAALVAYYFIHEGAHLLYALSVGAFKQINFMGLGIQIDVFSDSMSHTELFAFCLVGALGTLSVGYVLTALAEKIGQIKSKTARAVLYYVTVAFLLLDPLYLSLLCGLFGGGDLNGIVLFVPELIARIAFGTVLAFNALLFWKRVLPTYRQSFADTEARP